MEIIQTTSIILSDEEKKAIQTIIDAYNTCICNECFECDDCPLCLNSGRCLGMVCEEVRDKFEGGE